MATVRETIVTVFDKTEEQSAENEKSNRKSQTATRRTPAKRNKISPRVRKMIGTVSERLRGSINAQWKPKTPELRIMEEGYQRTFGHFPLWPPDAFAISALLLERSGTYTVLEPHHFVPLDRRRPPSSTTSSLRYKFRWGYVGRFNRAYRSELKVKGKSEYERRTDGDKPTPEDNAAAREYAKIQGINLPPTGPEKWVSDLIDPFGVLGENQLEIRLAGGLWAFGMLALLHDEDPPEDLWNGVPETETHLLPLQTADFEKLSALTPADVRASATARILENTVGRLWLKLDTCLKFLEARYPIGPADRWVDIAERVSKGYGVLCNDRADNSLDARSRRDFDSRVRGVENRAIPLTAMFTSHKAGQREQVSGRHVSNLYNILSDFYILAVKTKGAFRIIKKHCGCNKLQLESLILLTKWAIDYIQNRWTHLLVAEEEVSSDLESINTPTPPEWCAPAFRLMLLADEASATLGFGEVVGQDKTARHYTTPLKWLYRTRKKIKRAERKNAPRPPEEQLPEEPDIDSRRTRLSSWRAPIVKIIDRTMNVTFGDDYGAVLPKSRTSQVGCTLRSFSHNLAFLPNKGRVRARWLVEDRKYQRKDLKSTVQLLLLPFPFAIRSSCFEQGSASGPDGSLDARYGRFHLKQRWLEPIERYGVRRSDGEDLWGLSALLYLIRKSVEVDLDGVILPEYALDIPTYLEASTYLWRETGTRFIIAGAGVRSDESPHARDDKLNPKHNSVVIAVDDSESVAQSGRGSDATWKIEWARRKHHPWKLDARQLKRYGISHRLDPNKIWSEELVIKNREIGIVEFHPGSTFTALICEDLARIEPAQVAIRAIGPNLVFVLLMDGPQTQARWSNQYAGVLADEPGCSVLTMTSMGMIKRANASEHTSSRSFALWRDPSNLEEIVLPAQHHAVNITLRSEATIERTLDGRLDGVNCAITWKLAGVNAIKIRDEVFRHRIERLLHRPAPGIAPDRQAPSKDEFLAAFGYGE